MEAIFPGVCAVSTCLFLIFDALKLPMDFKVSFGVQNGGNFLSKGIGSMANHA